MSSLNTEEKLKRGNIWNAILANLGTEYPSFQLVTRGGLVARALVPGSSDLVSSPGRGHCAVFLGKTLNSHRAFLHPVVYWRIVDET